MVRSTHGVNCTGSCSWKVYVKDGIITWETQQTDYPSVGPDRPEYEPRGCPRGAAFSWYTYSPTRVRYPYVRGVLRRDVPRGQGPARRPGARLGRDHRRPASGAAATSRPAARAAWCGSRWDEAIEIAAAAHVHTIKTYGPDRCAGFSPIPAMSMVSHCVGTRFIQLIGGVMTSFYDWYADLPVASPQVFGDQTDVPESGDWWDATYLMMWGSNVPVTRTPDAHWMAEVRYRGTKVVTVSPDYADNTKFADEWLPAQAGTDAALAMAMGHVHPEGVLRRPPGAVLRRLRPPVHRPAVPGPRSTDARRRATSRASSSPPPTSPPRRAARTRLSRRCCSTRRPGRRWCRTAPGLPLRRVGQGQVEPRPRGRRPRPCRWRGGRRRRRSRRGAAAVLRGRRTAPAPCSAAACPPAGSAGTWSRPCRPDAGAVRRRPRRAAGRWPTGYDDAATPVHPGLAGGDHLRPGPGRASAWPASSPATPRSPEAAR